MKGRTTMTLITQPTNGGFSHCQIYLCFPPDVVKPRDGPPE
jgi:hypothetical protein